MCRFPVNGGSWGVVFACYEAGEERYLTILLDLLSKLDVSILFVQVFAEFIDFVFVYNSDRIVNIV